MPSPRSRSRSTVLVIALTTLLELPTEPWAPMAEGDREHRCSACRLGVGLGGLVETRLEVDDRDEPPGAPESRP